MAKWWNDKQLIAELNKQSADLKSGIDKGITWDELRKELLASTTAHLKIKYKH